ncbi:uncharacterized protein N7469_002185 [Penicillium citrinum]|uniref:Uncharacterized protein n=1 Tax=Penicillium citrinum TaxID=5077 RepID=A0A9W9TV43_PENCI|nr:uncharacterized protein N7469_002185 [Penicillium citrinum]KAJ5240594.1 hypothetical protein N7469_002185 [Penicillium citrinum]
MGSVIGSFWSGETPGPRGAIRISSALIALIGIICVAAGSVNPDTGIIYYIILGVATLWSAIVSFLLFAESSIHPAVLIALDLALAGVHYAFGIINAIAASSYIYYWRGNAIVAVFLLVVGYSSSHGLFYPSMPRCACSTKPNCDSLTECERWFRDRKCMMDMMIDLLGLH